MRLLMISPTCASTRTGRPARRSPSFLLDQLAQSIVVAMPISSLFPAEIDADHQAFSASKSSAARSEGIVIFRFTAFIRSPSLDPVYRRLAPDFQIIERTIAFWVT